MIVIHQAGHAQLIRSDTASASLRASSTLVLVVNAATSNESAPKTLRPMPPVGCLYRTRFPGHTFVLCRLA